MIVFISYAREDSDFAESLYDLLLSRGLSPWIDTRDIAPGETWEDSYRQAIKTCDIFIPILSMYSIEKRGHVQRELNLALHMVKEKLPDDTYIVPVRIDRSAPIPRLLETFQVAEASAGEWEDRLVQTIEQARRSSVQQETGSTPPDAVFVDHVPAGLLPLSLTLTLLDRFSFEEDTLPAICEALTGAYGWPEDRGYAAEFVLRELASNAFEHGCEGDPSREVWIEVRPDAFGKRLVIHVVSPGDGFDPQSVLSRPGPADDDDGESRGRGLAFVRDLSDRLLISRDGTVAQSVLVRERPELLGERLWAWLDDHLEIVPDDVFSIAVVRLPARIDYVNAAIVTSYIDMITKEYELYGFIFDMSIVRIIDSTGMGVFFSLYRRVGAVGAVDSVSFVHLSRPAEVAIRMVRMNKVFKICSTKQDAVERILASNKGFVKPPPTPVETNREDLFAQTDRVSGPKSWWERLAALFRLSG